MVSIQDNQRIVCAELGKLEFAVRVIVMLSVSAGLGLVVDIDRSGVGYQRLAVGMSMHALINETPD